MSTPDPSLSKDSVGKDQAAKAATGLRAVTSDQFNALDSVGGVRGLIESTAPGLVYLVVYVTTMNLTPALVSSLGVAALLVVIRLIQRSSVTLAFSGVFGIGIGLFIAWKSGDASDFYVWGLLVNLVYLLVLGISLAVRWPAVGVMVELLKSGLGATGSANADAPEVSARESAADAQDPGQSEAAAAESEPAFAWPTAWRKDPVTMKKYAVATWLWIAMFAARLLIQGPLYLAGGDQIAALGTARLVMGLPLFALVLWLTWRIVRQPSPALDHPNSPQLP